MKARLQVEWYNIMLSRRFIIETINRHFLNRTLTPLKYIRNFVDCFITYYLKWKKPSLKVFYSEDDFPMTA